MRVDKVKQRSEGYRKESIQRSKDKGAKEVQRGKGRRMEDLQARDGRGKEGSQRCTGCCTVSQVVMKPPRLLRRSLGVNYFFELL